MFPGSVGQRLMIKLVNQLGGLNAASRALGIGPGVIMQFIEGKKRVPDAVLLRAVDHVLEQTPKTVAVLPEATKPEKPLN